MNISNIKIKHVLLSITVFFVSINCIAQADSIAFAAADISRFLPNTDGRWQLFNSYVTRYRDDSARLELIIQHANNIDWTTEQYVGSVSDSTLVPAAEQHISFSLLANNYMLRIDETGRCYIRFVTGILPADDPFVIPLKILYQLR